MIAVELDGRETLNPWDLRPGETEPSNEKVAFLKNLTLHMIGTSPASDVSLLENVLNDAIPRVYKRRAIQLSNPVPTRPLRVRVTPRRKGPTATERRTALRRCGPGERQEQAQGRDGEATCVHGASRL